MADLLKTLPRVIESEGGYKLHKVSGDKGGWTFAGISRNYHPDWWGWNLVDAGRYNTPECRKTVEDFYRKEFWTPVCGDDILSQVVAEAIFDFGMNTNPRRAIIFAQYCVDCTPDGDLGPVTLGALNKLKEGTLLEELFLSQFALMRIGYRCKRCDDDQVNKKFLHGWAERDIRVVDSVLNVTGFFGLNKR